MCTVPGARCSIIDVSMSPAWMPKRCSCALNRPCTSGGWGRLNQLALYTSRPWRWRSSRATMSITATLPPWLLKISSFFTPALATQAPSSVHKAITVAGERVSVPGKFSCSVLRPMFCGGKNSAGTSAPRWGRAASITPCSSVASTDSGRCGPCCSTAATGSTATSCAAWPVLCSAAKSRVERSAQKRDGSGGRGAAEVMPAMVAGRRPATLAGMTDDLFRQDAYLRECSAHITAVTDAGIVLDRTVFYPLGGGQAGDSGVLVLADGTEIAIADTRKGKDAEGNATNNIVHVPAPGQEALLAALAPGTTVTARIDWERRHRMMRLHTTSHLLCRVVPQLVNGCSITPDYARLDFAMTDPLDKEQLTAAIATLVAAAHPLTVASISDEELDANPNLVKSMSVQPPRGTGRIRTIRIGGEGDAPLIDLQPCGGTHVANTAEIGAIVVTKIEKKSATTRRVVLGFAP